MFIEPNIKNERRGWIEVICGSMFSGKTEELIRRLKRAKIANLKVKIFKPSVDIRFHRQNIVSHDENTISSTPVHQSQSILKLAKHVDAVRIDQAQFFKGYCCGTGYGFYGKAIRANTVPACQSGLYYQVACHLREMWKYCELFIPENHRR